MVQTLGIDPYFFKGYRLSELIALIFLCECVECDQVRLRARLDELVIWERNFSYDFNLVANDIKFSTIVMNASYRCSLLAG